MIGEGRGLLRKAIAVTGGIGSGKSRVARWLSRECAIPLYDADAEVRSLLEPDCPGWHRLKVRLSQDFFSSDGSLCKARLRQAIFSDDALRKDIEHDLHPLVLANLKAKIAGQDGPCLVEVPLLYEVGWQGYFDAVLAVYAPEALCCERVVSRDRVTETEVRAAIQVQMPVMEKAAKADCTVDNSGPWGETIRQLQEIKRVWCPLLGKKA